MARRTPPAFKRVRAYIDNGFARRCRIELEQALADRSFVIVMAQPREGKSTELGRFMAAHPVGRVDGVVRTEVLATRVPHAGSDRNALMFRLGARLGLPLPLGASAYYHALITATIRAGVELIVIDDAHSLRPTQRAWIREFLDSLRAPEEQGLRGREVGLVLLAAGLPEGGQGTDLFIHSRRGLDIDWLQFEGRMEDPVWLRGLDLAETGEVLAGFEIVYREQFPQISLTPYAEDIFAAMLDPRIDYAHTGCARMKELDRLVTTTLRTAAEKRNDGSKLGVHLAQTIDRLLTRRQRLEDLSSLPSRGKQSS